jgi:prepilin-type N-terminal cleavage/methylation domain-containing protein
LTISNLRKFLIFLFPSPLFPSKNKKAAFTLAEVLITLGIIGVVAAITLPTLIQNYQKKTYVEGLKSGISILSQGFRKMLADEGVDDLSNTEMWKNCKYNNFNTSSGREVCEPILSKYFKVVKFQSQSDLIALGDTSNYNLTNTSTCQNLVGKTNKWWYLNDKTKCTGSTEGITITLANGMRAKLYPSGGNSYAGSISLDINGGKGPNTWGRDAFQLEVLQNGNVVGDSDGQYAKAEAAEHGVECDASCIKMYIDEAERFCSSTSTLAGSTCSGRIINDGWKMNY